MENTTHYTGSYGVCFGCRSLTLQSEFIGNYCANCHKSNVVPAGWDTVDTSSDSLTANAAALNAKVAHDALEALELMLNQIRDADKSDLSSLKMAAFMLRREWLEPTYMLLANAT